MLCSEQNICAEYSVAVFLMRLRLIKFDHSLLYILLFFFIRRRDASVLPRPHRLLTHFDAQRGARGPLRIPTETRAGRPVPPFSDILVMTPPHGIPGAIQKMAHMSKVLFWEESVIPPVLEIPDPPHPEVFWPTAVGKTTTFHVSPMVSFRSKGLQAVWCQSGSPSVHVFEPSKSAHRLPPIPSPPPPSLFARPCNRMCHFCVPRLLAATDVFPWDSFFCPILDLTKGHRIECFGHSHQIMQWDKSCKYPTAHFCIVCNFSCGGRFPPFRERDQKPHRGPRSGSPLTRRKLREPQWWQGIHCVAPQPQLTPASCSFSIDRPTGNVVDAFFSFILETGFNH